jgi:hypothetical protein
MRHAYREPERCCCPGKKGESTLLRRRRTSCGECFDSPTPAQRPRVETPLEAVDELGVEATAGALGGLDESLPQWLRKSKQEAIDVWHRIRS